MHANLTGGELKAALLMGQAKGPQLIMSEAKVMRFA